MGFLFKGRKAATTGLKQRKVQGGGIGRKSSSLSAPTKKLPDRSSETVTAGGGFHATLSRQDHSRRFEFPNDDAKNDDETLQHGNDDSSSCITEQTCKVNSWSSAGSWDHHNHSPLYVTPIPSLERQGSDGRKKMPDLLDDDTRQLGLILAKDRQLPGTWYYSSNHVLVNKERVKRDIPALTRRIDLDDMARRRAELMASTQDVVHGDVHDMQAKLYPCRRFGENVACGHSIRDIHKAMVMNNGDRNNMIDRRYTYMGMGTAKGEDGMLYLCQIFKG